MNQSWTLRDLDFVVVWRGMRHEQLPGPLTFTARTKDARAYERETIEARERMRTQLHPDCAAALDTLSNADLLVTAYAWDDNDVQNPKKRVRLVGGRAGDQGCVVEQLPGETVWHSGGFVIRACGALELGRVLAERHPEEKAGAIPELPLVSRDPAATHQHRTTDSQTLQSDQPRQHVDYTYGRSLIEDSAVDSTWDRSSRFLSAPTKLLGRVETEQGRSVYGRQGIVTAGFEWRDLEDDGRYAVRPGTPPLAVAVDTRGMEQLINQDIATVVRAIKAERG